MKLTPLDIKKQDFSKSLRGYDAEEVDAFLSMLANQWEVLQDEKRRAEERNRDLKNKIKHYENVEEALQEALQTARENKDQILENARREAKVIVREAESEATSIKGDAEERHKQLKREVSQLSDRRGEIVARLRAFLMSEMELLARFDGEDPSGFIKLVPDENQKQLRDRSGPEENRPGADDEPGTSRREEQSTGAQDQGVSDTTRTREKSAPSDSSDRDTPAPDEDTDAEVHEFVSQFSRQKEGFMNPSHPDAKAEQADEQQKAQKRPETLQGDEGQSKTEASPPSTQESLAESSEDEESPGWIVHSLFNADNKPDSEVDPAQRPQAEEAEENSEEDVTASSEEIEKIRRILSDMDD